VDLDACLFLGQQHLDPVGQTLGGIDFHSLEAEFLDQQKLLLDRLAGADHGILDGLFQFRLLLRSTHIKACGQHYSAGQAGAEKGATVGFCEHHCLPVSSSKCSPAGFYFDPAPNTNFRRRRSSPSMSFPW
jgi:hypothetical protein